MGFNEFSKTIDEGFSKRYDYLCAKSKGSNVIFGKVDDENEIFSYAFLDIKMFGITGIELAKRIKEKSPDTKIIFCTAYSEYAYEAFGIHALGYLLKPVQADDIRKTLDAMDKEWRIDRTNKNEFLQNIRVQTFGNFEVYVNGEAVLFERQKSKELMAYLIDREGAAASTAEIAGILWEDKPYGRNLKNQTTVIMSGLRRDLRRAGIESLYLKSWNHLAIDITQVKCDAIEFQKGDARAVNSYRGEYMNNYSWAEFSKGKFETIGH